MTTQKNAAVLVDKSGYLMPDSTVTVWDHRDKTWRTATVPERVESGGVLFWPRVAAALASIGWRLVPDSSDNIMRDWNIEFDAAPILVRAADLPEGSVVAVGYQIRAKQDRPTALQWNGMDGRYYTNADMDEALAAGAVVLRHGIGKED